MASGGSWTVVFEDKLIIKSSGEFNGSNAQGYPINDDDFWNQSKFSNIWAIQYGTSVPSDAVEYRDETPHSTWEDANLGDFQEFITRWDAAHLVALQGAWDTNHKYGEHVPPALPPILPETEEEKIARIGPRPTSYSS